MNWISVLLLACLCTPQILAAQLPSPVVRFPGSGGGGGPQRSVLNHEPVFGVGPHTTWRGGWGMELSLESEGGELVVPIELLYGVTEELTVTAVLPFRQPLQNGSLGSVGFRAKWRFATVFSPGRADALAVVGGVTVPRSSAGTPAGGPVITTGLAAGRESRRWYYFAGVRAAIQLADEGRDPGDRVLLNLAWGIRPWLTEYLAPDFVVLVEANGRTQGRTTLNGQTVDASGSQVLSLAPAVMLSYRNVMLKGGVDIPIWERVNDPNESADVTILAALELHW